MDEKYVALVIFAINLTWYLVFVVSTIGQITELLDINCLSIKHKNTTVVEPTKAN